MVYKPIWLVYHLFAILNDVSFKDEESVNKDTSMVVIDQWYRLRLFERPVRPEAGDHNSFTGSCPLTGYAAPPHLGSKPDLDSPVSYDAKGTLLIPHWRTSLRLKWR
jgi:hypothetical protein